MGPLSPNQAFKTKSIGRVWCITLTGVTHHELSKQIIYDGEISLVKLAWLDAKQSFLSRSKLTTASYVWTFSDILSPRLKAFCLGLTGHCSSSRFANILLKKRTSTELTVIGLVLVGSSVPFSLGINVVLPTQSSEV